MTHRLYVRLYLAFLGIAILSLLVTAVLARAFHPPGGPAIGYLTSVARTLECPSPAPCQGERTRRLTEMAHEFEMDVVLWDQQGALIFETGQHPFSPASPSAKARWHRPLGALRLIPLGNGNTLGVRERGHFGPRGTLFLPMLAGLAVLLAVGLLPLSRSITRRIEQLTEGARRWGEGDLGHRVPVSGRDEIAALASRFNQTAAAIEALLAQERQMLASASHEFRSPLARIRLALEILAEEADPTRRGELSRRASEDIAELDGLVEELLLATRAQPGVPRRPLAQVDLLTLVKGEAAAVGVTVSGDSVPYLCEPAMIKRMLRNLLANARLHGGGTIRVEVGCQGSSVVIAVEDDGPGVPEAEQERIFAPFYRAPGPRPPGDSGLGLGLALVRQIARYHNGDVRYLARVPQGSRFEVRLPLA